MSLKLASISRRCPAGTQVEDCDLFMVAQDLVSGQLMLPKVFATERQEGCQHFSTRNDVARELCSVSSLLKVYHDRKIDQRLILIDQNTPIKLEQ